MTQVSKGAKASRRRADRPVIYRGIKIAPVNGERSAIGEYIRSALWAKYAQRNNDPADVWSDS